MTPRRWWPVSTKDALARSFSPLLAPTTLVISLLLSNDIATTKKYRRITHASCNQDRSCQRPSDTFDTFQGIKLLAESPPLARKDQANPRTLDNYIQKCTGRAPGSNPLRDCRFPCNLGRLYYSQLADCAHWVKWSIQDTYTTPKVSYYTIQNSRSSTDVRMEYPDPVKFQRTAISGIELW